MTNIGIKLGQSRWFSPLVVLSILAVFGLAILAVTLHLRQGIRHQIIGRDAEILQSVALMQSALETEALPGMSLADPELQTTLVLRTSRLRGVVAVRLFDPDGRFVASFPPNTRGGDLAASDLAEMRELRRLSRYYTEARVSKLFLEASATAAGNLPSSPLLEIVIPFAEPGQTKLLGAAQLFMDGQPLAAEFKELDRNLLGQALAVFGSGGMIIVLGLGWALRRLQQANRELQELARDLTRTNQELELAAKTTAVGAVTAHLIHGLKTPLSGLLHLVSAVNPERPGSGAEWQMAAQTTRQLLQMINDIARLLRSEPGLAGRALPLSRVAGMVLAQAGLLAEKTGVKLQAAVEAEANLPGQQASLVALILENLLRNAIQATPAGRQVTLAVTIEDQEIKCTVRDEGPGFPEALRNAPFLPCQSTKPGGLGIGLAISKQLADHLGATLELESSPSGCAFTLRLAGLPWRPPSPAKGSANANNLLAGLTVVS